MDWNKFDSCHFGIEESNLARIKLGKRKFSQYEAARLKFLKGEDVAEELAANQPLKTANNRKWVDQAR